MCSDVSYTEGRHMGWHYPTKDLKALSSNVHPRAGGQSAREAAVILFVAHNTRNRSMQNGNYYSWELPLECLPSVFSTLLHVTQSFPLYLCILQGSKTGGGNGLGISLGS